MSDNVKCIAVTGHEWGTLDRCIWCGRGKSIVEAETYTISIDAITLSSMVRGDLQCDLDEYGATQESTMAVRGWLKAKGLWIGPDFDDVKEPQP